MMHVRCSMRMLGARGGLGYILRPASTSTSERQVHALNVEVEGEVPRPASAIPGPPILPFLGSIPAMMMYKEFHQGRLHEVLFRMTDDYGPIVKFKFPNWSQGVLITRSEDKEEVLRTTKDNPIRRAMSSLKKVRDEAVDNFFENAGGVLTEHGEEWWRVRRGVQTPMLKRKNVEAYLGAMDNVTLQFLDRIADFQKEFGEMPKNFDVEMYKWALESVSVVTLNRRLGCLDPNLPADSEPNKLVNIISNLFTILHKCELTGPFWALYPTPAFRKLQRMHQELLEIVLANISVTEEALKEALSKPGEEGRELTLMEQLLVNPDLSRKDVVTMILDMIFGGTDTTANTMAFVLYLLSKNPEAQRKLQEEVDTVLKDNSTPITPAHLAKMPYAKAVLKETLRVFPVAAAVLRELTSDTVLSGYLVPKGQSVMLLNYEDKGSTPSFQRADEFLPERWLRGNDLRTSNPYALLSFGVGTRMCLGRRIAEQEIYTFLARAMQRYTVSYNHGEMGSVMRLSLLPSKPWQFTFTERNP